MNSVDEQAIVGLVQHGGVHWFMIGALLMLLADHVPDFKNRMIEMFQQMRSRHPDSESMRAEAIRRIQSL
jgi:hypothetical protein